MFIYQTKKRELYYERVIALYQQTGYGKKRLGKLFPRDWREDDFKMDC